MCRQRKHGSFIEYLREKDPRIKCRTLAFEGRNTLLYMTAADYDRPKQAAARPDYNPCAQAAKAGDLELLKELRREGHPWNTEVQQCGAWAGHLHVLRYALANGCEPWSWEVCETAARNGGHAQVVEWTVAKGEIDRCEGCHSLGALDACNVCSACNGTAGAATAATATTAAATTTTAGPATAAAGPATAPAAATATAGQLAHVSALHEDDARPPPGPEPTALKQTDSEAWTFILREILLPSGPEGNPTDGHTGEPDLLSLTARAAAFCHTMQ